MKSNEFFINKIFEITNNINEYIDIRIEEENLPILKSHIFLFNMFPDEIVPVNFNVILKNCRFSKSSLSEIIAKYETIGLLEKVTCEHDKRERDILLTEEGLKVKYKLDKILSHAAKNLLKNINLNEEYINVMIDSLYLNSKCMINIS